MSTQLPPISGKSFEELLDDARTTEPIYNYEQTSLLKRIHQELDKDHKLDHKEKLATFIIAVTGLLPDPNDHCSAALKGDSSAGKDSCIKTILKHIPDEWHFFLTRGTQPALEDEANKVKIIAFSEINKHREGGANSELAEVFKQLSEGGIETLKKDVHTGYRTTKRTKSEQKTLLYGTTETQSDEELETRYVIIPIKGYPDKNQIVVNDVLDKASNENYYLSQEKTESWIEHGLRALDPELQVIIPFSHIFKKKIKDDDKESYLFDYTKPRIMRDSKRLLSVTRAITWLHQKQRIVKEIDGKRFVYSEPYDILMALEIFADFFNLTYTGLDHRLLKVVEFLKDNKGKYSREITEAGFGMNYVDWIPRHEVQKELGISSVNTIKDYVEKLKDLGQLEAHYDASVTNKMYLLRPINSPINKVSLPVSMIAVDRLLTGWLIGEKWFEKHGKKGVSTERGSIFSEIDRSKIDMSISKGSTHPYSKYVRDYFEVMKLEPSLIINQEEALKYFAEENEDADPELLREEFDKYVEHLKREGELYEEKPNYLRWFHV